MKTNKLALVTGGSRGLGRSMANKLADKGINVIITYHTNKTEADKVVAEVQAKGVDVLALQLDVSKADTFKQFGADLRTAIADKFGSDKLDFLINNAGIGLMTPVGATELSVFESLSDIHFKAPVFLTQEVLPIMNDGGGIINISSGLARFTAPGYAVYGSLKAAIEQYTRYQASELGARKIRVNCVAPGAIETDFGGGAVRDNADFNKMIADGTPLGRVGLPDDIGDVVAFLCTDESRWINGQRIEVSGGTNL
ncbi:MAG: 3-oxoacyl-(acyl-carrier-protein) reductase [Fluviicola sp.]|jgi:NAD(P)-dependent dehydrogenase (short-subunit alcohol dehydrogenase family)|uniref:SDR family NAD(P)-dependent oxidoreductase n=1 Tax=Fluviicola sp. TaxID=1917219 RepID=UPI00260A01C3|nr:SDR family oxidoreductase [Fluviicola sp.]MDF3028580.1 3-oxoacyl-(acyl-carrier-protein) reductase [Fluviicola sp.]